MKKLIALLLGIIMIFSLAACANSDPAPATDNTGDAVNDSQSAEPDDGEKTIHKIGWSCHYWNAYNTGMDAAIQSFFSKYDDIELITTDANNDATKQISDIEDLIAQGIEVLIVKAQDDVTISNVLGEAREKGITVILLQRIVNTDNYDYFVGADMKAVGADMGKGVLDAFPDGNFNYVMLEGGAASSTDLEITEGVAKVFEESGLPGIVKLDGQNCAANRAESKPITEDWITAYGEDIDVLLACNDEMLMGAIQAIQEAGIEKHIYLCGVNCTAEIVSYIQDGTVDMSFALNPGVFPGLQIAEAKVHGKDLSFLKHNWFEYPAKAITKDNIGAFADQVISSGLYMFGLLEPSIDNPLYACTPDLYPELMPLLEDQ